MIRTVAALLLLCSTASATTLATSSGDAVYTGPDAPDALPHPFQIEATFSPDFLSAHVVLSGDTSGSWAMQWVGMDEATRRFYDTTEADIQLVLTGSNFDLITDTDTFLTQVSSLGFEYFDPAYNPLNLTTDLSGSAAPQAVDVPEPVTLFWFPLLMLFGMLCTRKR